MPNRWKAKTIGDSHSVCRGLILCVGAAWSGARCCSCVCHRVFSPHDPRLFKFSSPRSVPCRGGWGSSVGEREQGLNRRRWGWGAKGRRQAGGGGATICGCDRSCATSIKRVLVSQVVYASATTVVCVCHVYTFKEGWSRCKEHSKSLAVRSILEAWCK